MILFAPIPSVQQNIISEKYDVHAIFTANGRDLIFKNSHNNYLNILR